MSEPISQPTEPAAEPQETPPAAEPTRRWHLLPWLTGAGFVVVAGALIWLWQHPSVPPVSSEQTDALARQFGALEARVSRLEQRPPPQVPDLGPLTARVNALEHRPPPEAATTPPPDLAPLERRVVALEQRQPPNLAPLEARIAAVQAAGLALAAGQKLGDLPGVPPALARFADTPPPTEAALRLAFPAAAREALAAAHPATENKPLLTRLWARAQDLVTVRQGDTVLVGDPAAGVLEHARTALDAGDLAAAVTGVATLQGAAAQAMAPWLAQARALLAARAALAAWAASG